MSLKWLATGLLVGVLGLTACAEIPGAIEEVTATPVTPTTIPTTIPPSSTPAPAPRLTPQPLVESLEIVILKSFPVQVQAQVKGTLPDSCTTLNKIEVTRTDNSFVLALQSERSEGACDMVLRFFEETIDLDVVGLSAGVYQVEAQGLTDSFTLAQDNTMSDPTPKAPSKPIVNLAVVESVDLLTLESFPVQIQAIIQGYYPDGCTTLDEIKTTYADQTFTITLTVKRPADAMCTEAIVPFEQTVPLEVLGLKQGTYTVVVNGATTQTFALTMDNVLP